MFGVMNGRFDQQQHFLCQYADGQRYQEIRDPSFLLPPELNAVMTRYVSIDAHSPVIVDLIVFCLKHLLHSTAYLFRPDL